MIKAVIFDMDGLLVDSEPLWRKAEVTPFKNIGVAPTKTQVHQLLGRGVHAYVAHFYREQPWEGSSVDEVVQQIIDNQVDLLQRESVLKPGVLQTLKLCKKAGLRLAVASSSPNRIIDTVVDSLKIRQYFDRIYSGVNEAYGKPHPGVFITTAGLLHVQPYNCLVFEDAPSGVLAAKAARMQCVAVPEPNVKNHPFIRIADLIIDSLEEFNAAMLVSLD